MSLPQISEGTSSTTMNDLDDKKSQPHQFDSVMDTAITIAELAKQLETDFEQKSMQSQLQSIDILEKTCCRLLGALQAVKASLTSCGSSSIQTRPAISLLTV